MPITKTGSTIVYTDAAPKYPASTGTMDATQFTFADRLDPTKQVKFDLTNVAANTTVTLTAPSSSITLGSGGGGGAVQYSVNLAGETVTITTADILILEPAGTLATLTVVFPTASDGKSIQVLSTEEVTALTLTAAMGDAFANPASTIAANAAIKYIAFGGVWYTAT